MFHGIGSSSARIFGIKVFGGKDTRFKRIAILPVYKIAARIRDAYWAIKHRIDPRHRYHVIRTDLPPGYYDVDTLILHGCFSLLCRYVENEMGGIDELERFTADLISGSDSDDPKEIIERQASFQSEAIELYYWWKSTLPGHKEEVKALMEELYSEPIKADPVEGTTLFRVRQRELSEIEVLMLERLDSLEAQIEREEREMLHRLIDIRGSLWV